MHIVMKVVVLSVEPKAAGKMMPPAKVCIDCLYCLITLKKNVFISLCILMACIFICGQWIFDMSDENSKC